jgi:hypothetical protein
MKKTKYVIINGDTEALSPDDLTIVEFTDEEYVEYHEKSFNRDVPPNLIISVEDVLFALQNTKTPLSFEEYFNE